MMAERDIEVAHTAILRWVQRYIPAFEKRWCRYARPLGRSWRIDETYIKVKGQWVYLYRGVDKAGQPIDFFWSEHRDRAAAQQFWQQATEKRGLPEKLTLAGYAASHEAIGELQQEGILATKLVVRTSKYLKNLSEQDHRRVQQRVRPMLGFKDFAPAAIPLAGIELVHQIKKQQFDVSTLCPAPTRTPQLWEAVLAA